MSKLSSLAIDLRNKVKGECQSYQFGGVTHYLDDRGYLLAKPLIEQSDVFFYLMNEHLTVSTNDVSETGLSLEVAGHFPVTEGTILRINFIRW
ncbi:MAG: hypothetical protein P8J13_02810 [Gammaproteobacteria bacterium]|nr:hypothetical protein [Gammaproteobacteria bacterium]